MCFIDSWVYRFFLLQHFTSHNWFLCPVVYQANVRQYYQQFEEQQTQSLIDQKVKEHLGQTAAALAQQQVGGAVYSHLSSLGGQYKPMPAPGLLRPPVLATVRPPVLPPPAGGPSPGKSSRLYPCKY